MASNTADTGEYVVKAQDGELPHGSYFYVWPARVKRGDLALFEFDKTKIVGRWFPGIAGYDWILQPERWIRVRPEDAGALRILGAIVPVGKSPRPITTLAASEYKHLFEKPTSRRRFYCHG
jgi:hypothetical protein